MSYIYWYKLLIAQFPSKDLYSRYKKKEIQEKLENWDKPPDR